MNFLCKAPREELADYITGYLNLEEVSQEINSIPLYPNNCSYFTYSYLNRATFLKGHQNHKLPRLFICGQVTESNLHLQINKRIGHLGVEFKPTGFYKLFQFDMNRVLNTYAHFCCVDNLHGQLLEKLDTKSDFEGRCNIIEEYVLQKLPTKVNTKRIDQCVNLLEEDPGMKIKDLCDNVAISERQLRRDFLKTVGVPPKVYAKIQQIKQVFLMINQDEKELLKEYAYGCGYYDVAHFINAFRNYIGQNPSGFISGYNDYISFYLSNKRK